MKGAAKRGRRRRRDPAASRLTPEQRALVDAHLDVYPPPTKVERAAGVARPRRLATLVRQGDVAADATVDLHGRTLAEAWRLVDRALDRARAGGQRIVRVITGKGLHSGDDRAVLRDEIPPRLRVDPRVAEVEPAVRARDGGSGVWFVRVRADDRRIT